MRWKGRRQSSNVEDRRGRGGGKRVAVGGGLGTIVIIIIVLLLGGNPSDLLQMDQSSYSATESTYTGSAEEEALADFVGVVLADTEDVWSEIFRQSGYDYREPGLVLFTGSDRSGCGFASAATGPFYCPSDQKIYIDLSFYQQLKERFSAPGDFAMAYVIAHEVGHHVQNLLGVTEQVQSQRNSLSQRDYNDLSVRLELQADFYAGLWARNADELYDILESGDLEEAMNAANAIGDDRLQKQSQGYTVPDSFTHGTSAQRMRWFKKGYETGDVSQGNTFDARSL